MPAKLKDGTTYYWRWKPLGGSWSAAKSFVTRREMFGTREDWPMWSNGPLAVNKVTGNLVLAFPGPSYSTAVGSMGASLTYNSLDARNRGLGAGWTLNGGPEHGATPTRLTDLHVLTGEEKMDAAEVLFADGGSALYSHVGQTNTYIAEPGDGSLLSKNPDGTWTLVDVDGSIYTFSGAPNGTSDSQTRQEIALSRNGSSCRTALSLIIITSRADEHRRI